MKTICLTMIVKNEINIIKTCLDSVKHFIDYWVICDTGSTDGTQNFIKNYFKKHNIEGELHETPWKNFGYNRTDAFKKAQNKADYYFVIDADDIFIGNKPILNNSSIDAYYIEIKYNNISYKRTQLFNSKYNWEYIGVLHEYAKCDKYPLIKGTVENCYIEANTQGERSKNKNKYKNDAEILLQGIKDEPNNERYYFYLANSYYDDKDYKNAKFYYYRRIEMKGWEEEVYYSMYKLALCKQKLQITVSFEEVLYDFLKAFNYRKTRLEALYEIVRYYRINDPCTGYAYGMLGYKAIFDYPNDILFINESIHKYQFMDELSVCAYWAGNYFLSLSLTNKLINMNLEEHICRLKQNKEYCINMIKHKYTMNVPDNFQID